MKCTILNKAALLCAMGVFFLVFSGCKSNPETGNSAEREIWALLEQGESARARPYFLGQVNVNAVDARGRTPLHIAAEKKDAGLAAFYIALGANVNALDHERRSPLGISAELKDPGTAKLLTAAGADIHAPMKNGSTPALTALSLNGEFLSAILGPSALESGDSRGRTILHLAGLAGNAAAAETILARGPGLEAKDRDGNTALDLALSRADSRTHMDTAEKLILAGAWSDNPVYPYFAPAVRSSNYNIRSGDGLAPLHYAAREGHEGLISFLIERNANVNIKNASGAAPLHEAARSGNLRVLSMILDHGAEINAQDAKGNSALHIGIPQTVHRDAAALLLARGINPNLRDVHGESPLHIAITLNRGPDLLQTLLGGGADVSVRNIDGKTALYLAIQENRTNAIGPLLAYGSDIFAADNGGVTPFDWALRENSPLLTTLITPESVQQSDSAGNTMLHAAVKNRANLRIAGHILDQKALVNARNKEGETALHLAARLNEAETGELLIARGADIFAPNSLGESPLYLAFVSPGGIRTWMINSTTLEARDGMGNTVLHYAAQWKMDAHIPFIIRQGGQSDAANATGETPLFMAVKYDGASTVRVLQNSGANIFARDTLGNSVLHAAVRWNAKEAANTLIDAGIDVNCYTLAGNTPLHDAVRLGIADLEILLIRRGARLEVRDADGNTPFMEAVMAGYLGSMERLADLGADPLTRNIRGDTPLHMAVTAERNDLANPLLSWGASIHARNARNRTPFQIALNTSPRMVSTLLTKDRIYSSDDFGNSALHIAIQEQAQPAVLQAIIDQGGRLTSVDSAGRTPLRLAMDNSAWDLAKILADGGSDPFSVAGDGKTPADLALSRGPEGVRALFSGRGIRAQDPSGNTILHYAAKSGSPELIALLLELGANKNIKNIAAESASDIARRWNQRETAALLN
ncbi:MAG: ankyrin repeat domain-containing protein [Treponema sp.]|jgi:ankyrin repeat protein|nr:ankyrin repeat domain-containing protein [Treponema sp.]